MFHLIADTIEREPNCLQTGLENIARWIANGSTQQDKLREWERVILAAQDTPEGMKALVPGLLELGKISVEDLRKRWSSMPLGEREMFQSGRNLALVVEGKGSR